MAWGRFRREGEDSHLARQRHLARAAICISMPLFTCCCFCTHSRRLCIDHQHSIAASSIVSRMKSVLDYTDCSINMFSFPFLLHSLRRRRQFEPKGNMKRNPKSCLCQRLNIQGPLCSIPRILTSMISPAQMKNHSHR